MKNIINWCVGFIVFSMSIILWGFGLTFSDAEVRGIFTLMALMMITTEAMFIGIGTINKMKNEQDI